MNIVKTAVVLAAVFAVSTAVAQEKPRDLPCVTWEPLTYGENTDPTDLFLAAYTWVMGTGFSDSSEGCTEMGDIFPCFSSDPGSNTWGHHDYQAQDIPTDYCRSYLNGSVYYSNNMYVPRKGPKWQTWKWHLAQTGGPVPANAIRHGDKVMARSTQNSPGMCSGIGFTGWAVGNPDGTFGAVHFAIDVTPVTTTSFEVAVCEAYHPTTTLPPTTTTTTTPGPTPAPTLPPNNKPYIRFGHTIPTSNHVDAVITQGNVTYAWNNYLFGEFSQWVEVFQDGFGTIDIYENTGGSRGQKLLTAKIPLTPGPLVVVIKDYWPPQHASNVETIAASYVPPFGTTGVRLFNLSPDTAKAGMQVNGTTVCDKIAYTLGSSWEPLPQAASTFTAFNDNGNGVLGSVTTTPPTPPFVFTNFLIGLNSAPAGSAFATRLVPLIDAPEF